ncbi:MAG: response regulator, partial [Myxococcales bacterium]|nr:response regulator [Myxococcales bacterium]
MIRVLVVDDSEICRELLADQLEADGDIEVVAMADGGRTGLAHLQQFEVDLVTVDIQMPGMSGLELIEAIMDRKPVPIIVVTSLDEREQDLALEATTRGALLLARKASVEDTETAAELRVNVRKLAGVEVARIPAGAQPSAKPKQRPHERSMALRAAGINPRRIPVVGVGSSAGGQNALFEILGLLPPNFHGCLAVAQHLPPEFVPAFARLIRSRTGYEVKIASEPVVPEPRLLVLAPGGSDLVYESGRLLSQPCREGEANRPRIDVLLRSLADVGVAPEDVDVIVLSHLHFDHAGGLLSAWEEGKPPRLLFDRATYIVGRAAWERAKHPHPRDRASYIPELVALLEASGRLE